jgi:hypothetical protein
MKRIRIVLLTTGVVFFLALAGCGGNGGDGPEPVPPPEDTVVVEEPDTFIWPDAYFRNKWAELYPMDSLNPLLQPWVGRWARFKAIDWRDTVYEIDSSISENIWEYFSDSHLYDGTCRWDRLYALDSLYLYTYYDVDSFFNPTAYYIEKYSFLEDGNILRLDYFSGVREFISTHIRINFYQRIKN